MNKLIFSLMFLFSIQIMADHWCCKKNYVSWHDSRCDEFGEWMKDYHYCHRVHQHPTHKHVYVDEDGEHVGVVGAAVEGAEDVAESAAHTASNVFHGIFG